MEIVATGRQAGKTYYLLQKMVKHGPDSVMICHSAAERDRLRKIGKALGLHPEQFQRCDKEALRAKKPKAVLVDNLDLVLPQLLGVGEITAATATGKARPLPQKPNPGITVRWGDEDP